MTAHTAPAAHRLERRAPTKGMPTAHSPAQDGSTDTAVREQRVREAAYRRAERRGFKPGHELEDWLAAEREFDGWNREFDGWNREVDGWNIEETFPVGFLG